MASDTAMNEKKDRLRVIIVGGSITGLTLAHSLYHSDIDFVVLEAHSEITPEVGASIAILPNGARILDQLGIFDDIFAMVEPLANTLSWTRDGRNFVNRDAPALAEARTGYPILFLPRRDLLKVVYNHLPDKSKVHTSKRVRNVEHVDSGVLVYCEDGSEYSGDIVVGADGVHSAVRNLMLKHIDISMPGATKKDRNSISAEYNCIFGIANPVDAIVKQGDSHRTYAKGYSTLSFVGPGGQLYFFLFSKLDKRYYGKDIPRYAKAEIEDAARPFFDMHMTDTITYGMVWEQHTVVNMSCVEESENEHWTSDRFVCLGDAIHKMTPNMGTGANVAIESVAALSNSIARLTNPNPSLDEVRKVLKAFYLNRHGRANAVAKSANQLTRIEALATFPDKIMAFHVLPALGDFLSDITCDAIVGAEILENLPPPARSLAATMPWDPETGIGKHEKKSIRALYALPLLLFFYACTKTMGPTLAVAAQSLGSARGFRELILDNAQVVPLRANYFGIESIDNFIAVYVAVFTPSMGGQDPASRMQMITFLADLIPIQAIWMIEGVRRGNFLTAAHLLPTLFGVLYQFGGIGYIAPIYFFLHYIQSPQENYQAADNRLTQMGPIKTIIPTILLTYIIPTIAMFAAPSLSTRQWINGVFWQPFPIYAWIVQRVLGRFVNDTTQRDRIKNPEADMPYLRRVYGFAGAAAALTYLYVRLCSPFSAMEIFFDGVGSPLAAASFMKSLAKALRYDQLCAFGAGTIWTMLSFRDLKKAGKLTTGWGKVVGAFAGLTLLTGPGAAMTAMWAWREEILAKRNVKVVKQVNNEG